MRLVRLLVLFDLPTKTDSEKKAAASFRKFLVEDGYQMEQFSVYSLALLTRTSVEPHLKALRAHLPPSGRVDAITLTESQFASREILLGPPEQRAAKENIGEQLTLVL